MELDSTAAPWLAGALVLSAQAFHDGPAPTAATTESEPVSVHFINNSDTPITLCWVEPVTRVLRHFYCINPAHGPKAIVDGSVQPSHTEFASLGDEFVLFWSAGKGDAAHLATAADVPSARFVAAYTATARVVAASAHDVTVTGTAGTVSVTVGKGAPGAGKLIDTSAKVYEAVVMAGFTVMCEPGVLAHAGLREALEGDLAAAAARMPPGAAKALRRHTTLWVNASLTYGHEAHPTVGRSMTYHPHAGAGWLQSQGMATAKAGGVEMFSPADFLESRGHWGEGGVILHELSHAFHDRCVSGGWDCAVVRSCFADAMARGTFDAVRVHGPQGKGGKRAKHYACANPMEFFAELSVALLWPIDGGGAEDEYNKWEPFNGPQLKAMDPAVFEVLTCLWRSAEGKGASGKAAKEARDKADAAAAAAYATLSAQISSGRAADLTSDAGDEQPGKKKPKPAAKPAVTRARATATPAVRQTKEGAGSSKVSCGPCLPLMRMNLRSSKANGL